jgi:tRNA A-37 threonylcarbamoyl transferase component Bud32
MTLFRDSMATVDEDARRRFEGAWRSGRPQPIEQFLPPADSPLHLPTLEELVHIEMELSWKRRGSSEGAAPTRVETYLERFPQLKQPEIVRRLARQEWKVRQAIGEDLTPEELRGRFPDLIGAEQDLAATWNGIPSPARRRPEVPGYEILEEIGRGGMGVVYKARHVQLDRLVALKMILRGGHAAEEDLQRFRSEAKAVAQLAHPNIVQIHEIGEQEGDPYIALEFVEGGGLHQQLAREPITAQAAAVLVEQLALAMHAVHQRGILHRDLKPANILLTRDGQPKITDFGLAKRDPSLAAASKREEGEHALTQSGAILGTPCYMAPEQAGGRNRTLSPATDVYALGAILYEALTGRPPFKGQTPLETLEQVRTVDPTSPRRLKPAVPRDLETICLKCLQKLPGDRYQSARELALDLRRFLDGRAIMARPVGLAERAVKGARRHPSALLAALLVLVILAGVAVAFRFWQIQRNSQRGLAGADEEETQIAYFAGYVKRWGVPEGIGPLTEEQAKHRGSTYRFHSRGDKVEKVQSINGMGFPIALHAMSRIGDSAAGVEGWFDSPECRFDYQRDRQGQLTQEVAHDHIGNVIWAFHYTTPTTGHYTDSQGFPCPRANSGAAYVKLVYSNEGFEQEVRYLDSDGNPRADRNRLFGERRELDQRGLPVKITEFYAAGEPRGNENYAVKTYDSQGNLIDSHTFDSRGTPRLDSEGVASARSTYDSFGNLLESRFFDVGQKPALCTDGYARVAYKYDDRGNQIEEAYFGLMDELVMNKKEGFAMLKASYDDRGYLSGTEYFDQTGKPAPIKDGYAKLVIVCDERQRPTTVTFFGTEGNPILTSQHIHVIARKFGTASNPTEVAYYGLNSEPTLATSGFFRTTLEYDGRGRLIQQSYFGVDDKPCPGPEGVARFTRAYDAHGNIIDCRLFGVDDRPTAHNSGEGYARWTAKYDDAGNKIESEFFGLDHEKPLLIKEGYSRWTASYDAWGDELEMAFFGLDRKPARSLAGYSRRTSEYDQDGNLIGRAHFDIDGTPLQSRVVVLEVISDTQAERLGLKPGDILATYEKRAIVNSTRFVEGRKGETGNEPRELQVVRDGKPLLVQVVPGPLGVKIEDRIMR